MYALLDVSKRRGALEHILVSQIRGIVLRSSAISDSDAYSPESDLSFDNSISGEYSTETADRNKVVPSEPHDICFLGT